jgi:hypothetical protein
MMDRLVDQCIFQEKSGNATLPQINIQTQPNIRI